ncbi:unnamed protein product [Lupinus luteus]|uniref:RING-type E3 ubiquitin transferase n=1 Tax=Lupinus luteus TaxID=3873 RepID=A0AAV1XJR4_LUPLU
MHHDSTSFPIIAIAIIGILVTFFLLVSYYIFVIKCLLNWHSIDILRCFAPSTRREDPSPTYSPATEPRGLNEALIRLIPLIQYKTQQEDQNPHIGADEDFVVIELGNNNNNDRGQNNALELPPTCPIINQSPRRLLKGRKLHNKVISMGDECIDIRAYEQFSVQPIRRSFSMDSSGDRHLYLTFQEALQQNKQVINEVSSIEGCIGSGRAKRSFFSFGHLSRSRSSVQPVYLDP